jgi:hypothetical protein
MSETLYTKKQMGDAGEMLVAAELTLHGIPAFIVPSNWPGYDVVAEVPKEGSAAHIGKNADIREERKVCWLRQ